MNESGKRVEQVKKDIHEEIRLIFGIAFFVMYLGCDILLLLTEKDMGSFGIKSILMLLIFIFMYLMCMRIIVEKVNRLFAPVDSYVIDSDKQIDILRKENEDKLDDIEAAKKKHEDIKSKAELSVNAFNKKNKKIKENKEATLNVYAREDELCTDINNTVNHIKQVQRELYNNNEALGKMSFNMKSISRSIKADYDDLTRAYKELTSLVDESMDVADSLISELAIIQSDVASMNINASHVALENARLGSYSFAITNGLDEIKRLSSRVNAKSDEVAGLAMKTKTNLRLCEDQADYCNDGQELSNKALAEVTKEIDSIYEITEDMNGGVGRLSEDINALGRLGNELSRLSAKKKTLASSTYSENDDIVKLLNNMGESLKNK